MFEEYKRYMAEYIAYILRTCDYAVPTDQEDWHIIVSSYSDLADADTILGYPIYVVANLGSFDFQLCIPAEQENNRKFLKVFNDRIEEVSFEEFCLYV